MSGEVKMLGQKTSLFWVDSSAAISATLLAATSGSGTGISLATWATDVTAQKITDFTKAIADGYTLNPTDSDTDDTAMVSDLTNAQRRGNANYEGDFQFAMERNPVTNATSIFLAAYTKFKNRGVTGWWVQRIGKQFTSPLIVADKVHCYYFSNDNGLEEETDGGGPIWFHVPFRQQGQMRRNVAVAA